MPDEAMLPERFAKAASGWLTPCAETLGWSDWLGPRCAIWELARATRCRFDDESQRWLGKLLDADHEHLATLQIEHHLGVQTRRDEGNARARQLAGLMRGSLHAVQAAEALHEWEPGMHNPMPAQFVNHAGLALAEFGTAWRLGEGPLRSDTLWLDSNSSPKGTMAMVRVLDEFENTKPVTPPAWLAVHRILNYILGDAPPVTLFDQQLSLLLLNKSRRGEVRRFLVQVVAEGQAGCYLDPISTGLLVVDDSMQQTIRVAWNISRPAFLDNYLLAGEPPAAIRLAPQLPTMVPVLTGMSAGGLFACGMYGVARKIKLNDRGSASFCLDFAAGDEPDQGPMTADQLRVGPTGDLDQIRAKLEAAVESDGQPPLTHVVLERGQAEALGDFAPGRLQIVGVETFWQAFAALTGDAAREADLHAYSKFVSSRWHGLRHPVNLAEDEHRLDHFVEPRYATLEEGQAYETSSTERPGTDAADVGLAMGRYQPVDGKGAAGLANLLGPHPWLCLVEDAGAGKSVFARRVEHFFASDEARLALSNGRPWLVVRWENEWPVNIHAGVVAELRRCGIADSDAEATVDYAWKEGRVVLILDALDQQIDATVDHLEAQLVGLSGCRILVTSRAHAVRTHRPRLFEGQPWKYARVELFDQQEQDEYLMGLDQGHLRTLIPDREAVGELMKFPVVLRMIRWRLEAHARSLLQEPTATPTLEPFRYRGDLYWDVSEHLLDRAFKKKRRRRQPGDVELLQQLLATMAFEMMLDETSVKEYRVPEDQIRAFLAGVRQRCGDRVGDDEWKSARELLADTHLTDRCLMEGCDERHLGFRSKKMMEFFAGVYLARYASEACQEQLRQNANAPDWYWPFRFAIEMRPKVVQKTRHILCRSLAVLFDRPDRGRRPTELMYRAWHYFENDRFTPPELRGRILPDADKVLHAFRDRRPMRRRITLRTWVPRALRRLCGIPDTNDFTFCPCPKGAADRRWFWMGSSDDVWDEDERPRHKVELTPFEMQQTTVTFAQYREFDPAHEQDDGASWVENTSWAELMRKYRDPVQPEQCPVTCVTWYDAWMFAKWLGPGFRLPTEAEWEFACRAGRDDVKDLFHFGQELSPRQANFGMKVGHTTPRGTYPPNAWGLDQMHGNVWEWCWDGYSRDYYQQVDDQSQRTGRPVLDPMGPSLVSFRLLRGGAFDRNTVYCRSASRNYGEPVNRYAGIGFRLVR